ncbi:hypothetical protein [Streptomyces mexicanus]|uniref:hypothetical protein n=1 Tax=Streptomyces mexicanus TaxID=178566 RepID=UPI0036A2AB8F
MSATSSWSKADQDPATWLPPTAGHRCLYVTDWVADKLRWGLSVDADERIALAKTLNRCLDSPVTVTLAR